MQKTTAQSQQESSQQESQKTWARLVLFWKPFYKKKNMRAFNVARPRQRNIYQITSPTTGIKFACIQTSKRTSFEQLFHLDYFTSVRTANSPRLLYLAASWLVAWWFLCGEMVSRWRNSLVARWPDAVTRDRDNKAHTHTHTIHIYLPFTRKSKDVEIKRCENCSSRNLTYKFCTGTH